MTHTHPRIHNAMWPGLVGKGSPGAEPAIDLDTMLDLTAKASVDGAKFDGVDLFLFDPHVSIDAGDSDLKQLADKIASKGFVVGSLVAPVWPPTGGGSAMGYEADRGHVQAGLRRRGRFWRAPCRRRRDLLGRDAQLEADGAAAGNGESSEDARFPGRHGAHAALHDGLQRARGSAAAGKLRLERSQPPR